MYLRHLNENSPDYHDTLVALKVVTDVAEHANNSMKQEVRFLLLFVTFTLMINLSFVFFIIRTIFKN